MKVTFKSSIADIPAQDWNRLAGATNPFLSYAFLSALETSGSATPETGWTPHHVLLIDKGTIVGAAPLYVKVHSQGEYVFDHGWADAFHQAGGKYYPKLLSAIPFTPVPGRKLLGDYPDALATAMAEEARRLNLSSAHILFIGESEKNVLEAKGFLIRTGQQFHWQNIGYKDFDDFLSGLKSAKRKTIRKERKAIVDAGIEVAFLDGPDITASHWDLFYACYLETCMKRWGQAYLNRSFFTMIGQNMPQNLMLVLARRDGQDIAGALHVKGTDTLFGRYWGCLEHHDFLHFELCYYRALDYAIHNKLKSVEAGAQGGHKLYRGYTPVKTYSAHWIEHRGFREAVENYLRQERAAVDQDIEGLAKLTPFKKG